MRSDDFADLRAGLLKLDPHEATEILGTVVRRIEPELRLKAVHDVLLDIIHTGAGNDTFRLEQVRNDIELRLRLLEGTSA